MIFNMVNKAAFIEAFSNAEKENDADQTHNLTRLAEIIKIDLPHAEETTSSGLDSSLVLLIPFYTCT